MRRRTVLRLVGAAAAAETLAIACVGATTERTAPPATAATAASTVAATAARPTGRISIYSALDEPTSTRFAAAFKAATPGVDLDLLPLAAADELRTRIRAEKASPKADIFVGGDSSLHDGLAREGLLEPYTSRNAGAVAAEAKDPNNTWTGWDFGILGIVTNTDRFGKEIGGARPAAWDDLLDPKYTGKLILPDPIKAGDGYIFIATQLFRFGRDEAKMLDYMRRLDANIAQYPATSSRSIQLVSQGQFVACPSWAHDILTEKSKDPGIDLSVPKDTSFEIGAVSIVKGTKDLPAAKAFVDWVLTKEAAELNVKLSNRVSVRKDVAPAPGSPALGSVSLVAYERDFAAANKDRLLRAWRAAVGR